MKYLRSGLLVIITLALILGGTAMAEKYSSVKSSWMGVYTQEIDDDIIEAFDLDRTTGALVVDVVDDSPADKAGLRAKDIIISYNGEKVTGSEELIDLVRHSDIGQKIEIVYDRNGKEKTTTVEIGRRPKSPDTDRDMAFWNGTHAPHIINRNFAYSAASDSYIGTAIQDLNDQLGDYFGVKDGEGVLITEIFKDSPAEEAGLKAGDVIVGVDGENVAESRDLIDIIADKEEGDVVDITYLRKGAKNSVKVTVDENTSGMNAFTMPGFNFRMPNMTAPNITSFGFDDDNYFKADEYRKDMDEYRRQMEEYRQEVQEMKKELNEIRKKLD